MSALPPQRDRLVGLAVPPDDSAVLAHALALLKRHGLNVWKVAAVYSAGCPRAVRGRDTVLYVNHNGEPRHANIWRVGPNRRTIRVRSDAEWPVEDPPPLIL